MSALATAGALLALAGGTAAVVASVSGADSDDQPTQSTARATSTAPPAFLRSVLERKEGVLADFALEPAKAQAYTLGSNDAMVWIVPGKDGSACLFDEEAASVCAPAEQLASRGIVLITPPLPPREYGPALAEAQRAGLTGEKLREAVPEKLADVPNQSGPATYFGYAPPNTESVRLLDANGKTLAQAKPTERV